MLEMLSTKVEMMLEAVATESTHNSAHNVSLVNQVFLKLCLGVAVQVLLNKKVCLCKYLNGKS